MSQSEGGGGVVEKRPGDISGQECGGRAFQGGTAGRLFQGVDGPF